MSSRAARCSHGQNFLFSGEWPSRRLPWFRSFGAPGTDCPDCWTGSPLASARRSRSTPPRTSWVPRSYAGPCGPTLSMCSAACSAVMSRTRPLRPPPAGPAPSKACPSWRCSPPTGWGSPRSGARWSTWHGHCPRYRRGTGRARWRDLRAAQPLRRCLGQWSVGTAMSTARSCDHPTRTQRAGGGCAGRINNQRCALGGRPSSGTARCRCCSPQRGTPPSKPPDLLIRTLLTWLDAGGSANAAGAALFCHPNTDLRGLDIASIAKGFGLRSVHANTADEIRDQFTLAAAADGPTVIVVETQPQDAKLG